MTLPPGPKPSFIFGNLREYRRDSITFERRMIQEYGDIVGLKFGTRDACIIYHPDDIQRVLVTEASKFRKAPAYRLVLKRFLGDGLLTSEGEFWRRQRKLAQPAFHHNRIKEYADVMVNYAARLLDDYHAGEVRDMNRDMMRVTLNIVSKTLFDADVDEDAGRVSEALTTLLHMTDDTLSRPFRMLLPDWLPFPTNRRRRRAIAELDDIINGIINQRRASGEDKGDLLSMLLLARDENGHGMSDVHVRDEAVTLFLAGHETTANALTWTWYLLSQHPEVEAKLHEELDRVLGGRLPTLDDLKALEYTAMVIKESMRLMSPVPAFGRQAREDIELGGYHLGKRTIIVIAPHVLHRDPRWWDEPEAFRPERFSKENEKQIRKYTYLPFAAGPRVCIGNMFAEMEANLVLATMAQQYRLTLEPGQDVTPVATLTLRPKNEIHMRLVARQPIGERETLPN